MIRNLSWEKSVQIKVLAVFTEMFALLVSIDYHKLVHSWSRIENTDATSTWSGPREKGSGFSK